MRLVAPVKAPDFDVIDVRGNRIRLSNYRGRRVMLSFFRDASCPFCNFRCYELTHSCKEWRQRGLEIIAFFHSDDADILHYMARYPRPFIIIGDPNLEIYVKYGIERSLWAVLRGTMLHIHRMLRGMTKGPLPRMSADQLLVPADFLIDERGLIQEVYYGRDIGDHIPITRIRTFIEGGRYANAAA
ncbi:MAG TPA: redoxin domain-containing protein [Gammaproteobacteria bacterium]|nr:redoxin domain-containing protein [Gammaproteobacteria bacterium]